MYIDYNRRFNYKYNRLFCECISNEIERYITNKTRQTSISKLREILTETFKKIHSA